MHVGLEFAGVRWIGAAYATAPRRSVCTRIAAAGRALERRGRLLNVKMRAGPYELQKGWVTLVTVGSRAPL
jgi:hypothetical protein